MQVCTGVGVGLTRLSLEALLQTLACNVGGHTHTHTHTPELLAARSIALHALCFTSLEKCFQNKKFTPKLLRINRILIPKFGLTDINFFNLAYLEKYSVTLNNFEISKNSNYLHSNNLNPTVFTLK